MAQKKMRTSNNNYREPLLKPYCLHCTRALYNLIPPSYKIGLPMYILQMEKTRLREVRQCAQRHTANGATSLRTQVCLQASCWLCHCPLPDPKPRDRGAEQSTHLTVHHLGMFEDGNDVAHHSHAQLIHDFLVEIQQHALLDPAREGQC